MREKLPISLILFLGTLWLARAQGWTAGDVAWSMWLASLCVGYAFIVFQIFIANPVARGLASPQAEGKGIWFARGGAFLVGLFALGFFTVHFGMFHAVHAVFLDAFFPLNDQSTDEAGMSFNIVRYLVAAFPEYWPFVFAAGVAQASLFISAWRGEETPGFGAPYRAVVKNHVVIIALGFLTAMAPGLPVLGFLLLVYFFPWGEAFGYWRSARKNKKIKA